MLRFKCWASTGVRMPVPAVWFRTRDGASLPPAELLFLPQLHSLLLSIILISGIDFIPSHIVICREMTFWSLSLARFP